MNDMHYLLTLRDIIRLYKLHLLTIPEARFLIGLPALSACDLWDLEAK